MPDRGPSDAREIPALTALRALAALLVFLYHFPPQVDAGPLSAVWREGHVGVSVFFVLSGFLITSRYYPRFARGGLPLTEYFLKRMARILPLYWTVLALSLLFGRGHVEISAGTWPEWTLTQAFFSRSVHHLAVPTSWSLTLEECFYALAPLLFLGIAGARRGRRAPALAAGGVLCAFVAGLGAAGVMVARAGAGTELGFLNSPHEVALHTIFGRFADFAVGAAFGLLQVAGRPRLLRERKGWASAAALLGGAGIVGAQCGLQALGPAEAAWPLAWLWNLALAGSSGVLVLALGAGRGLVARGLGLAPFVYLGRVSYALYLIQSTPLGLGFLDRVLPAALAGTLPGSYLALNAVSAVFYELVEEPARQWLLALRDPRRGRPAPSGAAMPAAAWALALAGAAVVAVQAAAWRAAVLDAREGPLGCAETLAALGPDSRAVFTLPLEAAREQGDRRRAPTARAWAAPVPAAWMRGRPGDLRAPATLRVFLDEGPIPFVRREELSAYRPEPHAWFSAPRSRALSLALPAEARGELTLVHHTPWVGARLQAWRVLRTPGEAGLVGLAFVVAAALGALAWPRLAVPRVSAALLAGLVLWLALDVAETRWALPSLAAELLLLAFFALRTLGAREPAPEALAATP